MTSTTETYNGWKNYETWMVNLHLSNDRSLYERVNEIIEEVTESDSEYKRADAADAIKDLVEELTDTEGLDDGGPSGMFYVGLVTDLLGAALAEVDWFEIADAWLEEV